MNNGFIYILSSYKNGTLYVGVINNLVRRIYEHKNNLIDGFTRKYQLHTLVYYEELPDIVSAIKREKQLKNWRRSWKVHLVDKNNPGWTDL